MQIVCTHIMNFLQHLNLFIARLLQRGGGSPLFFFLKVTIIAEGGVEGARVDKKLIFVFTEFYAGVLLS